MKTLKEEELVRPIEVTKTKFKFLRRNFPYTVVLQKSNTKYYLSAGDILFEVDLPQSVPAPPGVGYRQTLTLLKEESKVKWIVK